MARIIGITVTLLLIVAAFIVLNTDDAAAPVTGDVGSPESSETVAESEFGNPFRADTGAIRENLRVTVTTDQYTSVLDIGENGDNKITADSGNAITEYIQLGNESFFKDANSRNWITYNTDPNPAQTGLQDTIEADVYDEYDAEDVEDLGTEACSSGTCRVYRLTSEGVTGTLYVDTKTNRITKWVSEDEESGQVTIEYDYDVEISITRPENVKTIGL